MGVCSAGPLCRALAPGDGSGEKDRPPIPSAVQGCRDSRIGTASTRRDGQRSDSAPSGRCGSVRCATRRRVWGYLDRSGWRPRLIVRAWLALPERAAAGRRSLNPHPAADRAPGGRPAVDHPLEAVAEPARPVLGGHQVGVAGHVGMVSLAAAQGASRCRHSECAGLSFAWAPTCRRPGTDRHTQPCRHRATWSVPHPAQSVPGHRRRSWVVGAIAPRATTSVSGMPAGTPRYFRTWFRT